MLDLCSPVAMIAISRASRIVATPMVTASRGTYSSPKKSAAASRRVTASSVTRRVRLSAPEPGLVEADVSRLADAENLEVDAAGALDRHLVALRRLGDLRARDVAGRDVHVLGLDVDVREQILPHEAMVGVDAVLRHRVVLVEIERHDVGEAQSLLAVHPNQLAVHADRRRARREAEHRALARRRCVRGSASRCASATSRAMSSWSSTTTVRMRSCAA